MARPRKKFRKVYDLGDFSLEIDTYKKKVVFFHLKFCLTRDGNGLIKNDVKHQLKKIISDTFDNVQGRKIFDISDGEMMRGNISYIRLSGYLEIFDDFEEYIIRKCNEMIPNIQNIGNKCGFTITKRISKRNGNVERDTEF